MWKREGKYIKCTLGAPVTKVKFGVAISEDLASWLDGAAESWNLSRSAVVELSVRTLREFIGSLSSMTETRGSRALAAFRSLTLGEVPPLVDLQALAEELKEPEEALP